MEKMVFVVRKAEENDIAEIQEITREAFKMYSENAGIINTLPALIESYEDIKKDISTKHCLVAVIDGKIVGSVRVEVFDDGTAYLSRFGVGIDFQNKGVGRILMNAVDKEMKDLKIKKLCLHTASRVLSLVRFYYGRGFYIESTTTDRGYIRALLCKEYEVDEKSNVNDLYENFAV